MALHGHSKAVLNKCVFRRPRKSVTEELHLTVGGMSFQIVGAATAKARVASLVFIVIVGGNASR